MLNKHKRIQTCFEHFTQIGKSLLDRRTDGWHGHDIREAHVPHDRPSHQPRPLVVAVEVGSYVHGHSTRPGESSKFLPPSVGHMVHIKTQNKCYWDQIIKLRAVLGSQFKVSGCGNKTGMKCWMREITMLCN